MFNNDSMRRCLLKGLACGLSLCFAGMVLAQRPRSESPRAKTAARNTVIRDEDLPFPPELPDGKTWVRDRDERFLKPTETLREGVLLASETPTVEFTFFPGQNYPGRPWSNWGDGSVSDGRYYTAIGDHLALGRGQSQHGTGTALVYEVDAVRQKVTTLADVSKFLALPGGHYTPGKVHTQVVKGSDGWIYYATHRGSTGVTTDANHYLGDWILRSDPESGRSEVVVQAPVPKHCIPNGMLDPDRLIYYGGTAPGSDADSQEIWFFAYDVGKRKLLYAGEGGPSRAMILARSTGRVYFVPGNSEGTVMRYDPATNEAPVALNQTMGIRAATSETAEGLVYTVSTGQGSSDATIWEFNTRTEDVRPIGSAAVGKNAYVASIDVDPTGRYLYYVPGAHGGADVDGSPIVQFDIRSGHKKVIAFLHPYYQQQYGFALKGTYSTALSEKGDRLFITWNISRGTRAWDCCGLTVVTIPESERQP